MINNAWYKFKLTNTQNVIWFKITNWS